jgi:hypothetical protein
MFVMAELADPARGRSWVDGMGAGELSAWLPVSAAASEDASGSLDSFESLRDGGGSSAGVSCCGVLPAAPKCSLASSSNGLKIAVRFDRGESKRPYRGRAGRSGITLSLFDSDTDVERARPRVLNIWDCANSLAVAYDGMTDSLMLRLCLIGVDGPLSGSFVRSSPNLKRLRDGG